VWGFGGLTRLHDSLEQLFDLPLTALTRSSQLVSGSAPTFDVFEDKDSLYVRAELPGLRKEDINLSLHDGSLSISGERKSDENLANAEVHHAERFYGRFERTMTLPAPVAVDKVTAQYKDGILTITLPKAEEAKPKTIDVSVN
jgi:HSP20 family protein